MTTITKNTKTGRATIEEDGYAPAYGAYVEGATTRKVSVLLVDLERIERGYDPEAYRGSREWWAAVMAAPSRRTIRKGAIR